MRWQEAAACKGMDTNIFFPPSTKPTPGKFYTRARKICGTCPVQIECLAYAQSMERDLNSSFRAGMYGGLSPIERTQIVAGRVNGMTAAKRARRSSSPSPEPRVTARTASE